MPANVTLVEGTDHGRRALRPWFSAAGRMLRTLRGQAGHALGRYCAHYWRQAAYDAAGLAELRGDELVTAFRLATGMGGMGGTAAPVGPRGDCPNAPRRDARQA
jgi:hypothetical protein